MSDAFWSLVTPILEGAPNFRHIGGWPVADGGTVRPGRVFRSEVLTRLTAADLEKIAGFDIRLIFDLRLPEERARDVNRWPEGRPVETLVVENRDELADAQTARWRDLVYDGQFNRERARNMMFDLYRRMPRVLANDVALLFERLDTPEPPVVLVHCTGGKDRTGIVCALLLWSLGVSMADIQTDYLYSRRPEALERLIASRLSRFPGELSPEVREALLAFASVMPEYLEAAFEQVRADFGSIDAFLEQACRLDPARRARLRASLVDSRET